MRAVLLTRDSPDQVALAQKLSSHCELAGIVLSRNIPRRQPKRHWRMFLNRVAGRLLGRPFLQAWWQVQAEFKRRHHNFPENAEQCRVENVNSWETIAFLERFQPAVVLVSSTNLVGDRIIEWATARRGILNLHTGLAPYMKGGPNCTNWCLAERQFHLIGNTVMWLDLGIDTGAIASTAQVPLSGRESLFELHWRVQEHAQDLYARVVGALAIGRPIPRIPQNQLGSGRTYYTVDWNVSAMRRAWSNFKMFYTPELFSSTDYREQSRSLHLVLLKPALQQDAEKPGF